MKLTLLQNVVFAGKAFAAGEAMELDELRAKRFVKAGLAKLIDAENAAADENGEQDKTPDAPAQDAGENTAENADAATETAAAISDKGKAETLAKAPKQTAKTASKGNGKKAAKK